jgi:hypothetical protein
MECMTRSGRIVRVVGNRKKDYLDLQLYTMSLSEGPILKCKISVSQIAGPCKRSYPSAPWAWAYKFGAELLHRSRLCIK